MRSDYSKEETMARVHQVMGAMGLNKCKDTKIGILGKIKGISGGEKKRLAVASEVKNVSGESGSLLDLCFYRFLLIRRSYLPTSPHQDLIRLWPNL